MSSAYIWNEWKVKQNKKTNITNKLEIWNGMYYVVCTLHRRKIIETLQVENRNTAHTLMTVGMHSTDQ